MSPDHLQQEQFLDVVDRDEAEQRFHAVLDLRPLETEEIALADALGRVLADAVASPVDVPGFDRSNVDGFAVRAEDTFGASEDQPRKLRLNDEILPTGVIPKVSVHAERATCIATGAMVPRGADAVVMIEDTDLGTISNPTHKDEQSDRLILHPSSFILVSRPIAPGANITFAGTDIGKGETVLRRGQLLTARETGVLAALGLGRVPVVRRPRVAVVSTGDELAAPGQLLRPGQVFDSNSTVLADAVREIGAEPVAFGIVPDDEAPLAATLRRALNLDVVLLSGGTSKGAGDVSYRAVAKLGMPGIVVHGVALKPGKPLCLAAVQQPGRRPVPVVVLPGFPTSAIFTFQEFVAPVIRRMTGQALAPDITATARLPQRFNSERGRTEAVLVGLVTSDAESTTHHSPLTTHHSPLVAYPLGKGSGSVTAFGAADGFIVIPRQHEYLETGELVEVRLLARSLRPADLVVIGSHCVGLDWLLGRMQERGFRCKFLAVGSTAGLAAARRGECDLAGIHLLDPKTNSYNRPFLNADLVMLPGYTRRQGIVFRPGDTRFEHRSVAEAICNALADPGCVMVNRNRGSGTRILIDRLLGDRQPPGYWTETRSHNAVAAAVTQARADWGVAIAPVAAGLGFLSLQDEHYDFAVPKTRFQSPAVQAFQNLLHEDTTRHALAELGFARLS